MHDLLDLPAGVPRDHLGHLPRRVVDLACSDLDVRRGAAKARRPLVDHHARVRKSEALARRAAGENHRRRRHADAVADRPHVRSHVLHRVVDRHTGIGRSAGRVHVEVDVAVGILGLEEEQLGGDQVGDPVLDLLAEEDDAIAQQPGVDVERALEATVRLDDDGE